MLFAFLCGLVTGAGLLMAVALHLLDQLDPEAIVFTAKAARVPAHLLQRFLIFLRNPFDLANRTLFHALIRLDYAAGSAFLTRNVADLAHPHTAANQSLSSAALPSISTSTSTSASIPISTSISMSASASASTSTPTSTSTSQFAGFSHTDTQSQSLSQSLSQSQAQAQSQSLLATQSSTPAISHGNVSLASSGNVAQTTPHTQHGSGPAWVGSSSATVSALGQKEHAEDACVVLKGHLAFWLKDVGDASILSRWCVIKLYSEKERKHCNLLIFSKEEDEVPIFEILLRRSRIQSAAAETHHKWAIEVTEFFQDDSNFGLEDRTTKSCTYYLMPKKEKYKEWFYVLNRYSSQEEYRILVKNFKPTFIDPLSRPDDPVTITKMLEEPCFKSGWLETRESGLIRVWRWRWIVLEESSLQVFDSEEANEKVVTYFISNAKIQPTPVSKSRNFGIEIRRPDNQQPILFNAYTEQERNDWVQVLKRASALNESMMHKSEVVLYSTWMAIQLGTKTKYWKWYFFTFSGSYFKYYKNADRRVCVGVIALQKWVVQDAKQKTNKDKTFEIINYSNSDTELLTHAFHTFQAPDVHEYKEWMRVLQENSASNLHEYSSLTRTSQDGKDFLSQSAEVLENSTSLGINPLLSVAKDPRATNCYEFNVILDRVFMDITRHSAAQKAISNALLRKFERIRKPNFVGALTVDNIDFGTCAPCIANFRLLRESSDGELDTEFDLTYGGGFSISLTCEALVNWPVENPITIPVQLTATIVKLNGKMSMKIPPLGKNEMRFSFYQQPDSDFMVSSILTSSLMTFDSSRLDEWLREKLTKILHKAMVMPNSVPLQLPRTDLTLMMHTIFRSRSASSGAPERPNASGDADSEED